MTELTLDQQLDLAMKVAAIAHQSQFRKDGTPYIWHVACVALRCNNKWAKVAAMLHDTVEDTSVTFQQLREMGFSSIVIDAVDGTTRRKGETYSDFILRCVNSGDIAIEVKLADIDHNMADQSALDPEDAEFLTKRYTKARKILMDAGSVTGYNE